MPPPLVPVSGSHKPVINKGAQIDGACFGAVGTVKAGVLSLGSPALGMSCLALGESLNFIEPQFLPL